MKIILIIFLLLAPVLADATIISTSGDSDLEALDPDPEDTVRVQSGHTLTIDDDWNADDTDTTCLFLDVLDGGTVQWTGNARCNVDQIAIDGTMTMSASDTLGIWGGTATFTITAGGSVTLNGGATSTRCLIYSMDKSNRAAMSCNQAVSYFDFDYVKFNALNGVTFNAWGGHHGDSLSIYNCIFDSAGVNITGRGVKISTCSMYVVGTYDQHLNFALGSGAATTDTVMNCYLEHDNQGSGDASNLYGIRISPDSCLIRGTTINSLDTSGENGRLSTGISIYPGQRTMYGLYIINDSILNGVYGTWFGVQASDRLVGFVVDSSVIISHTHESLLFQTGGTDTDSAFIITNNVISGGGFGDILLEQNIEQTDCDINISYNTFCAVVAGQGDVSIYFRNRTESDDFTYSGFTIIGNIFIGYDDEEEGDLRVGSEFSGELYVLCDEFKDNAYNEFTIDDDNTFGIEGDAYIPDDSNLHEQDDYGFVDSVNFDFRLAVGSPMLNAAEGTSKNIGYYQGAAVGAETPLLNYIHSRYGAGKVHDISDTSKLQSP